MNLGSDRKTYAEAVIGSSSFGVHSGKVTKYWGWCKGQIVAYRKHDGYLIKFDDRIAEDGTVVAGWSDWIEDLNSKDVRLLDP